MQKELDLEIKQGRELRDKIGRLEQINNELKQMNGSSKQIIEDF